VRLFALVLFTLVVAGGDAHARPRAWTAACKPRFRALAADLEAQNLSIGIAGELSIHDDWISLIFDNGDNIVYRVDVYRKIGDRPANLDAGDAPAPRFKDDAWHTYYLAPPPHHDKDVRVSEFRQRGGLEAYCFMRVYLNDPKGYKRDVEIFHAAVHAAVDECLAPTEPTPAQEPR
jgi:hypothetical protein